MQPTRCLRQWAQNLNRATHEAFHTPTPTTIDAPLLSPAEILALLARLQGRKPATSQRDEVAHRQLGDARSVFRGQGMDLEESRTYQPGDDTRHMNWRLSARSGELQMKVFREERRPGVFILVDRRAAMRFGTRRRLKVTQAARAAAIAAFAASQCSAAVTGVMLQKNPRWLDAATGEQAAFELIRHAAAPCPPLAPATDEPGLGAILRRLQEQLIPGSTLYLISDFIDLAEQDRPALLHLASTNRVHAIYIHDPAERDLPNAGKLHFIAGADRPDIDLDTADSAVRHTYHAAAETHADRREDLLRGLGISCLRLSTTEDAVEALIPLP